MMNINKQFLYWVGGKFEWDEDKNGLRFDSIQESHIELEPKSKKKASPGVTEESFGMREITFKEELDVTEKLRFRKYFLRKCKLGEPEFITLQDIKDIVIFTADPNTLTTQFIDYLHMPTMDNLLRAFIVYFQYYFLEYKKLMNQRDSLELKIKHPDMVISQNNIRDDLSDLRSMVSREYCSMLVGADETLQFHHMSLRNGVSLSDKDRRLTEVLIKFSTRVVWYALHKPNIIIIANEIERLVRSKYFNRFEHQFPDDFVKLYDYERHILTGTADIKQPRIKTQSPLTKEVIYANHDYRMLAAGQADFPPNDSRKRFFEMVYITPEEYLRDETTNIGILGMRRMTFDIMFKRKRKKKKKDDDSVVVQTTNKQVVDEEDEIKFNFIIPSRLSYFAKDAIRSSFIISKTVKTPKFDKEANRIAQCEKWKKWVCCPHRNIKYEDVTTQSISHISTAALYL